jgi:hypothetical protein
VAVASVGSTLIRAYCPSFLRSTTSFVIPAHGWPSIGAGANAEIAGKPAGALPSPRWRSPERAFGPVTRHGHVQGRRDPRSRASPGHPEHDRHRSRPRNRRGGRRRIDETIRPADVGYSCPCGRRTERSRPDRSGRREGSSTQSEFRACGSEQDSVDVHVFRLTDGECHHACQGLGGNGAQLCITIWFARTARPGARMRINRSAAFMNATGKPQRSLGLPGGCEGAQLDRGGSAARRLAVSTQPDDPRAGSTARTSAADTHHAQRRADRGGRMSAPRRNRIRFAT